jgi:Putative type VII ESX secretion system translocon, EccE
VSSRRYRFGPLEKRTLLGPLTVSQVAILGSAALLGIVCLYTLPTVLSLLVGLGALMIAGGSIALPIAGRSAADWTPVVARWFLRSWRHGEGFRSTAPAAGIRTDAHEAYEKSLPPELSDVDLLAFPYGGEEVGVIRDGREGTYTAALAVRAGSFALRDSSEQVRILEQWGGVLASCSREGSPLRRLQWIERTPPGEGDALASYLQEKRDRTVPVESTAVSSYIELLEAAAPVTQEHEVLIALQIDTKRAGRELKRFGGGDEGAARLLLREAENLARRLTSAEINVFGLLRPRQYAEVIKDAFDPFGHQGRRRASIGEPEREGVDPLLMGPQAEQATWSTYRTDSAFHRTYWVCAWPRSEVGATFLAPLLMQSAAVRTVSVTIEPVPYSRAMRNAEMATTANLADEVERERQGFITTARDRRQQQAIASREAELAEGFAEVRVAPFITVSAKNDEALEHTSGNVEHGAQLARLELQPMYGEQDAGFANTLPICRGLRG